MNEIETDFDKLKHYEDIETYYPPLDDIKDFLYELFGDRVESQKYIVRINQKLEQLQSNWNSLREYSKENIKVLENRLSTPFCNFEKVTKELMIHQNYLDKMNELEGREDENRS